MGRDCLTLLLFVNTILYIHLACRRPPWRLPTGGPSPLAVSQPLEGPSRTSLFSLGGAARLAQATGFVPYTTPVPVPWPETRSLLAAVSLGATISACRGLPAAGRRSTVGSLATAAREERAMFRCERCGTSFAATRVEREGDCPRCWVREGVRTPLVFKLSAVPPLGAARAEPRLERVGGSNR
jgi:hypothetical protein